MKSVARALAPLALAFAAGCFTAGGPAAKCWTISADGEAASYRPEGGVPAEFPVTRLGPVTVLAPYDVRTMCVLRSDGSLAFDAYNQFAAQPAQLLRNALLGALEGDGRFGSVVNTTSTAAPAAVVEVLVSELALDCRSDGVRMARMALRVDVIAQRGGVRDVVRTGRGAGSADAADGNYSAAFTAAASSAMRAALADMSGGTP